MGAPKDKSHEAMEQEFQRQLKGEFVRELKHFWPELEQEVNQARQNGLCQEGLENMAYIANVLKGTSFTADYPKIAEFFHLLEKTVQQAKAAEPGMARAIVSMLTQASGQLEDIANKLEQDVHATPDTMAVSMAMTELLIEMQRSRNEAHAHGQQQQKQLLSSALANSDSQEDYQILVLEDDQVTLAVIEKCLAGLSPRTEVHCFMHPEEALHFAQSHRVDAVVTDHSLPQMLGTEFMMRIKRLDSSIPIIFLTGAAQRAEVVTMLQHGAYDLIEKPFNSHRLLAAVRNGIRYKTLTDKVKIVSTLNYRAFLLLNKLLEDSLLSESKENAKPMGELSTYLEKINDLTSEIAHLELLAKK